MPDAALCWRVGSMCVCRCEITREKTANFYDLIMKKTNNNTCTSSVGTLYPVYISKCTNTHKHIHFRRPWNPVRQPITFGITKIGQSKEYSTLLGISNVCDCCPSRRIQFFSHGFVDRIFPILVTSFAFARGSRTAFDSIVKTLIFPSHKTFAFHDSQNLFSQCALIFVERRENG